MSYIYFWKAHWDGTVESLVDRSKRLHHHPNEHTPDELKLIRDMRRRNPQLGLTEYGTDFANAATLAALRAFIAS